MEKETKLLREIEKERDGQLRWAKVNNITDISSTIMTIVSSALATILVSKKSEYGLFVAAVPGVLTSLQKVVNLRGKAIQYYVTVRQYTSIARRLEYGDLTHQDAVSELNQIDEDLEKRWLATGKRHEEDSKKDKQPIGVEAR